MAVVQDVADATPSGFSTGNEKGRMGAWRLAAFAAPCIPVAAMLMPVTVYLPDYYTRDLGLSWLEIGFAFSAVRLFDLWLDPTLGFLIDKTNTRWGRFRPWLVAGLPMAVLAIWMLFMAGRSITGAYILFWLVIGFTGQSMASMAHIAWAARIAPEYGQRSRVYGWWQAFNVVISNVPGPKEPLYWNGARLQGMYPVSIVLDRIALNITVTSYGDSLEFGLIACRRTLPSMQRLLDYLENSMRELEVAAGVCGYNSNRVLTLKSLHPQAFFHSCLPQPP